MIADNNRILEKSRENPCVVNGGTVVDRIHVSPPTSTSQRMAGTTAHWPQMQRNPDRIVQSEDPECLGAGDCDFIGSFS
jgi:hypothetical protein